MKFKKSYLLLIVIAIFLLISIGSVCASENVTDNSDDTLAEDGTDVVLSSDTDGNVPDDTTQEKINTTVETGQDSYEFKQDSNKTIQVDVKDNRSSKIDINKSDLSISDGNKNISFEYNSSIITITENLAYGHYNLTITYLGNANYTSSYNITSVKIFGNNTIETETSVVCNGKDIEIPIKIYDQVDYIELVKENFNLTLVYTNETGNVCNLTISNFNIENGTIKFESPVELINASVIVDYANATEPSSTLAWKIPMERGVWRAAVHGVAKSPTRLKRFSTRAGMRFYPVCPSATAPSGHHSRAQLTQAPDTQYEQTPARSHSL